jgi:hypothetical protein
MNNLSAHLQIFPLVFDLMIFPEQKARRLDQKRIK